MGEVYVIGIMKNLELKIARIRKGLSQWDLAGKTEIPNYRISLIETGRVEPKADELKRLADALGTSPETLTKEVGVSEDALLIA